MKTRRWLLPFMHDLDMQALDAAMRIAEHGAATLVALSLVAPSEGRRTHDIRLEQIQESKDFLEAVRWKAARHQVAVEFYEVFTEDVLGSINTHTRDLDCQSIILLSHGRKEVLLPTGVLKQLLTRPPASLLFLSLPAPERQRSAGWRFLSWIRQFHRRQDKTQTGQRPFERETAGV